VLSALSAFGKMGQQPAINSSSRSMPDMDTAAIYGSGGKLQVAKQLKSQAIHTFLPFSQCNLEEVLAGNWVKNLEG